MLLAQLETLLEHLPILFKGNDNAQIIISYIVSLILMVLAILRSWKELNKDRAKKKLELVKHRYDVDRDESYLKFEVNSLKREIETLKKDKKNQQKLINEVEDDADDLEDTLTTIKNKLYSLNTTIALLQIQSKQQEDITEYFNLLSSQLEDCIISIEQQIKD